MKFNGWNNGILVLLRIEVSFHYHVTIKQKDKKGAKEKLIKRCGCSRNGSI